MYINNYIYINKKRNYLPSGIEAAGFAWAGVGAGALAEVGVLLAGAPEVGVVDGGEANKV